MSVGKNRANILKWRKWTPAGAHLEAINEVSTILQRVNTRDPLERSDGRRNIADFVSRDPRRAAQDVDDIFTSRKRARGLYLMAWRELLKPRSRECNRPSVLALWSAYMLDCPWHTAATALGKPGMRASRDEFYMHVMQKLKGRLENVPEPPRGSHV